MMANFSIIKLKCIWRRFYLSEGMTNLYPFIRGSWERSFSELFLFDALLWNQYKFIAFNIFLCRISIISWNILIAPVIPNEKSNELGMFHKKWSFPLRISTVNTTKSTEKLWIWSDLLKISLRKNFLFCAVPYT